MNNKVRTSKDFGELGSRDFDDAVLQFFVREGVNCRDQLFKGTVSNTQALRIAYEIRNLILDQVTPITHKLHEDINTAVKMKNYKLPAERRPAPENTLVMTGTLCSVCGEKQFNTSSGITCKNGHDGIPFYFHKEG